MQPEGVERPKEIEGVDLRTLTENLYPVAAEDDARPAVAITDIETKLGTWQTIIHRYFGADANFLDIYPKLPLKAFEGFSFDELCKLRCSTKIAMEDDVKQKFETEPQYRVIEKIRSSIWRWGYGEARWNEIVAAYEGLRHFTFSDNTAFEVRLDYSTWYNQYGLSEFSRTYLDGVFGFLVYYKGKHVMTLGFSFTKGQKLLLQQVQLAQRSGNRFLYQLPENRLEYVIERFAKHFPHHELYLIEGESLIEKTQAQYQAGIERKRNWIETLKKETQNGQDQRYGFAAHMEEVKKELTDLEERLARIQADTPRLLSFYSNTGHYTFGEDVLEANDIRHRRILSR